MLVATWMDEHDITLSLILPSQRPLKHKKEHQQGCRFDLRYISYIHLNDCSRSNLIGMCETPNTLFGTHAPNSMQKAD